ncbi:ATP-binding protein [Actinoplanes regularis]|uniref:ATP-binding protein n=1 Tax=Actinoplanes regularis TaxID=52697 RepID=UPI0024A30DCA|nr:ATP-binding protein [Actinoplanes regularis]GLW33357.1 hypothetical protein Areg01_62950 [Actinoplanes regularis]
MDTRTALLRTCGFAGAYLVAGFLGRLAVADGSDLSLVWPAAGVAGMWFLAQRSARTRWVDVAALAAATAVVNLATGLSAAVTAICVVNYLIQPVIFVRLLTAWCPAPTGHHGMPQLRRLKELWALLAASLGAAVGVVVPDMAGQWLTTGETSWSFAIAWVAYNAAALLLVTTAALRVRMLIMVLRARHGSVAAGWRRAARDVSLTRAGEYLTVTVCTVVGYGLTMTVPGVSMVFPLIALTVWAAVRLSTTYVAVHSLVVAAVTVLGTWLGTSPFAHLGSPLTGVLVAQVFIATVTIVGLALALGRDERAALTAELAGEKDQAARQAQLMNAIANSMADGMGVHDRDGRLIMHNPALKSLLGRVRPPEVLDPRDFYGFRHLDGTPVTEDDLPWRRVSADGQLHSLDLVASNPDLQHDRIIRYTATPLIDPDGALNRSVVVLRDITAETRHRDELAGFAGVVAHDLLNPLTTIEGWTEAVEDTLAEAPEHPSLAVARSGLARVDRAAARMRGLVNDLLAYTTARDAALMTADIDINNLAADVAAARIDTATAASTPAPVFTIGDLHPVHADPVLLRQLLDNLISNAVKYTATGLTPHITITSSHTDDTVAVTVADNGIGIPAGQHNAIFDNFHRAHRGAGYAGTGLGLAICQRTVQRHGGTITATDNPSGGARFTFTLPAVGDPAPTAAPATGDTLSPAAGRPVLV